MRAAKLAQISGVAHLTPKFRHMAETLHGPGFVNDIFAMAEDAVAVDALAGLLDRAFSHALSTDGRLDLREAAMFVLKAMKEHQKP